MKINDYAFLWKRWAQLTFLLYMQPEHTLVTVMPFDLIIQYLKCLSKKEFDPLWLFWGWSVLAPSVETVSHTEKRFSFHLTKKRVKIKRPWLFLTSITAPFCSSRSMSSVLKPSPVLQTHPWYIFLTEQLVIFFYFPYFLELDDRHIILVLKWAMIKLGFNIRTYLNKVWELSIISPSIREMKILELSRNCCNCACTNSHSSCRLLLNPCPSSFFPPCEKSQGYYNPCIFILYTASSHSQFCTTTIWNISLWEALLSYGSTKSVQRHGKLHPHHQKGPLHQSVVRASFSHLLCC